jgi:serine/threonine-protein kinase
MSPEQARSGELDHRSDQWSLAVVAFEALTGHRPFPGSSAGDVIARICADELPVATRIAPDLPKEIDRLFARAMCRSPDGRFPGVRAFADELARIAATSEAGSDLPGSRPAPSSAPVRTEATLSAAPVGADAASLHGTAASPLQPEPTRTRGARARWIAISLTVFAAVALLVWRGAFRGETAPADAARPEPAPTSAGPASSAALAAETQPVVSATPASVEPESHPPTAPKTPAGSSGPPSRQRSKRPPATPDGTSGSPRVDPRFGIPVGSDERR